MQALIGDLLINVTGFFRDPEAWDVLREKVVAPLVELRGYDQPVRVWVPACSTGEEAYTIAMLLLERAEEAEAARHQGLRHRRRAAGAGAGAGGMFPRRSPRPFPHGG